MGAAGSVSTCTNVAAELDKLNKEVQAAGPTAKQGAAKLRKLAHRLKELSEAAETLAVAAEQAPSEAADDGGVYKPTKEQEAAAARALEQQRTVADAAEAAGAEEITYKLSRKPTSPHHNGPPALAHPWALMKK